MYKPKTRAEKQTPHDVSPTSARIPSDIHVNLNSQACTPPIARSHRIRCTPRMYAMAYMYVMALCGLALLGAMLPIIFYDETVQLAAISVPGVTVRNVHASTCSPRSPSSWDHLEYIPLPTRNKYKVRMFLSVSCLQNTVIVSYIGQSREQRQAAWGKHYSSITTALYVGQ